MRRLRRLWNQSLSLFGVRQLEQRFADELALHIQMQTEENVRAGMLPADAQRAATLKFGGMESAKESLRDQRGLPGFEAFFKDFAYAWRGLRKSPGFTTVVIATHNEALVSRFGHPRLHLDAGALAPPRRPLAATG